ncbi:PDDEXK nuclease domain-containing protein [Legionella bozemanae]|uniref:PDDEXK nuclease domain-containing protein n=1 Tax=Legionella bozemanae TaxID=447 RepID=UPI001930ECF6|nr:PDDEXK nuclease domain-containing protein [Legionella bozemanae]
MKVGRFEPEYLGKLSFYLESLDRTVKKAHENSSIGLLLCLCASKDKEVVEFSLNRTLSPALIAEYQIQLPDKKLLSNWIFPRPLYITYGTEMFVLGKKHKNLNHFIELF